MKKATVIAFHIKPEIQLTDDGQVVGRIPDNEVQVISVFERSISTASLAALAASIEGQINEPEPVPEPPEKEEDDE